jgi:hypothetical protein
MHVRRWLNAEGNHEPEESLFLPLSFVLFQIRRPLVYFVCIVNEARPDSQHSIPPMPFAFLLSLNRGLPIDQVLIFVHQVS